MNKLFKKYTKDKPKPKPKPYCKVDWWDCPLVKAPGGRSFEADVYKVLRLISKEIKDDITRYEIEEKVLEVGGPAGMLASTIGQEIYRGHECITPDGSSRQVLAGGGPYD